MHFDVSSIKHGVIRRDGFIQFVNEPVQDIRRQGRITVCRLNEDIGVKVLNLARVRDRDRLDRKSTR